MAPFNVLIPILYPLALVAPLFESVRRDDDNDSGIDSDDDDCDVFSDDDDFGIVTTTTIFSRSNPATTIFRVLLARIPAPDPTRRRRLRDPTSRKEFNTPAASA